MGYILSNHFGKFMIVLFILWLFAVAWLLTEVGNKVEDAGGAKQILIDVGKEAKDIYKEIQTN